MKNRIAIKITLIYFITGFIWILFSDQFRLQDNNLNTLILFFCKKSDQKTGLNKGMKPLYYNKEI